MISSWRVLCLPWLHPFSVGRATVYRVLHRAKQKTAQAQEGT